LQKQYNFCNKIFKNWT